MSCSIVLANNVKTCANRNVPLTCAMLQLLGAFSPRVDQNVKALQH